MNIINYENYNAQLIQGFDNLPVLVGKHACTPDFKVMLSEPEDFKGLVATTSEVRTKRNVLGIIEKGTARIEKRGHKKPTRVICYLSKP